MTEQPNPWDRLSTETDPAFEGFLSYLETGSIRDAYRLRTGSKKAPNPPGSWKAWSSKHHWVSRRSAYVDATIRECLDLIQVGLVRVRLKFVDESEKLLDRKDLPAKRLASDIIRAHFPPVQQVADVTPIEDLTDLSNEQLNRMREIRDSYRNAPKAKVH